MAIRIIFLGDIVGTPGRQAVAQRMGRLREEYQPDLVIANAENAANGSGLTPELYKKLCAAGVDAMTLGDHVFKKSQIVNTLNTATNLIRPANLPATAAGSGSMVMPIEGKRPVAIVTVLGRMFMALPANDPFQTIERVIGELPDDAAIVVEVHGEATSEKQAIAWQFNGRVSAVLGTHTHVPTADARILPPAPTASGKLSDGGTAFISDVGMCGPHESVLGRRVDRVLKQMTTAMHSPFDVADRDPRINGVLIEIDETTRRAKLIDRIEMAADVNKPPFVATNG